MSGQNRPVLRRSRRLATIVPASDWIGMGYAADAAAALEYLQRDIQVLCAGEGAGVALSSGGELEINLEGRIDNDHTFFTFTDGTPHNDLMLSHWEKLAKALALGGVACRADSFSIRGIKLTSPVLDTILSPLSTSRLGVLELETVELGREGYLRLASFLRDNKSLTQIRIGGELLLDLDIASSFSDAISAHPSMQTLLLCDCGLFNTDILRRVVSGLGSLVHIGFLDSFQNSECSAIIANFFRGNSCLGYLDLSDTNLSDFDALTLASALTRNKCLQILDLSGNNITDAGNEAILSFMYDASSMDSVASSNHVCRILTRSEDTIMEHRLLRDLQAHILTINEEDICEGKKIRMKVVIALCGDEEGLFDRRHLNGVPLKLMPRVLEIVQARSEDRIFPEMSSELGSRLAKFALSRVFQVVREMPSVFQNVRASTKSAGKRKRNDAR